MIESRFIFYPESELVGSPAHWGLDFQEVRFPAKGGVTLHGWFVPGDKDVTWIWFHGNAGNISHRLENLTLLHRQLGVNILLFDYRGYGLSEGRASEKGTYQDATAALEYVLSRQDIAPHRIVYFGRSLGAAVALWLATRRRPYGLILESPFASVQDMAKVAFPHLPLHLLVRGKYDSLSRIASVSCPLAAMIGLQFQRLPIAVGDEGVIAVSGEEGLILHGARDEIVPVEQAQRLYAAATQSKALFLIPGAGHNDTYSVDQPLYFRTLAEFMTSLEDNRD